eukprot:TRINITY_DN1267_c0_g1_i2.p1 TRINITY_DN1267_c0_g1~~TRINITY_DN1267_c0_g1_i2.p1  ORF type:complete len:739 (+),score=316.16 TRINITY_DN1267_c0_g1_i2:138-2354(+)
MADVQYDSGIDPSIFQDYLYNIPLPSPPPGNAPSNNNSNNNNEPNIDDFDFNFDELNELNGMLQDQEELDFNFGLNEEIENEINQTVLGIENFDQSDFSLGLDNNNKFEFDSIKIDDNLEANIEEFMDNNKINNEDLDSGTFDNNNNNNNNNNDKTILEILNDQESINDVNGNFQLDDDIIQEAIETYKPEIKDDMPIAELLMIIASEIDESDNEVVKWLQTITDADRKIKIVLNLKEFIENNEATWNKINIPLLTKEKIEEFLDIKIGNEEDFLNSLPSGFLNALKVAEEDQYKDKELEMLPEEVINSNTILKSKKVLNKNRIRSVISPSVMDILNDGVDKEYVKLQAKHFKEDDGVGDDLADEIEEMNKYTSTKISLNTKIESFNLETFDEEELEWMDRVLDECQRKHMWAVARLYLCREGQTEWTYTDIKGGVAIVTEADLRGTFFHSIKIVDLAGWNPNKSVAFQQEIYDTMEYTEASPFFHIFEVDNYVAGLSFVSEQEAKLFYKKVKMCLETPARIVIQQDWDQKEKCYILPGESRYRIGAGDMSNRLRQKYMSEGGIMQGTDVKWKKPALPAEVRALIGPRENEEEHPVEEEQEEMIDLLSSNLANQRKLNRSHTISAGASPTLFAEGNNNISDGISVSWKRGAKSLTDDDGQKSNEQIEQIKQSIVSKIKQTQQLKRIADKRNDKETSNALKRQILDLRAEYRKYNGNENQKYQNKKSWRSSFHQLINKK